MMCLWLIIDYNPLKFLIFSWWSEISSRSSETGMKRESIMNHVLSPTEMFKDILKMYFWIFLFFLKYGTDLCYNPKILLLEVLLRAQHINKVEQNSEVIIVLSTERIDPEIKIIKESKCTGKKFGSSENFVVLKEYLFSNTFLNFSCATLLWRLTPR